MLKRSPNQVSLMIIKRYFCIKVFLIHNFHPKPRSLWVSSFISELVLTEVEWQLSWQLTSSTYFFKYNLINNLQHQHGEKIQVALLKMHLFTTLSNPKENHHGWQKASICSCFFLQPLTVVEFDYRKLI